MGNGASARKFSIEEISSQAGKVIVVTGGNTGIGFAICKVLAKQGAKVIVASRDSQKVMKSVEELRAYSGNSDIHGEVVDLASLSSIDRFAGSLSSKTSHIDVLINNAGLFIPPHSKTENDFEITLGVNAVGTAYLTSRLLHLVEKSVSGRIIMLSTSAAVRTSHSLFEKIVAGNDIGGQHLNNPAKDTNLDTYGLSNLIRTMYGNELQRRISARGITNVYISSAHPGIVNSEGLSKANPDNFIVWFLSYVMPWTAVATDVGALSSLYLATAPLDEIEAHRGHLISEGPNIRPLPLSQHVDFTPSNLTKIYEQLHQTILSKGFAGLNYV